MATVIKDALEGSTVTREHDWLAWLALLKVPLLDLSCCVSPGSRLVVVAPHPDDEVLGCGGLMRMHQQHGGDVLLVAVTEGEASHADVNPAARTALAIARRAERATGLARLARQPIKVLHLELPDGAVSGHTHRLDRSLKRLLRPTDLVVSVWRSDGHPDHDAVGQTTALCCEATGCRMLEAPVWMWHWAYPADDRVPWEQLRALPLPAEVIEAKANALAAHTTQLRARTHDRGPVLDESMQARARRSREYYFVA